MCIYIYIVYIYIYIYSVYIYIYMYIVDIWLSHPFFECKDDPNDEPRVE